MAWVTTLVAAERNEEKENARPTATVITQVEGEFKARGFAVSLAKSTVNCYIQNDMVGSVPLARGYEGISQSNLQTAHPCRRIIHTDKAMPLSLCSTALTTSWMATSTGLPTKIWRFFSGGRVCFHQR